MPSCAQSARTTSRAYALLDDPHWTYHAAKKLGMEQSSHVLLPPYGHWLKR